MSNFPSRCARPASSCRLPNRRTCWLSRPAGTTSPSRSGGSCRVVDHRLFVSADAGETWDVVPVDARNGRRLFVMDERLVLAVSSTTYSASCSSRTPPRTGHGWKRSRTAPDSASPATSAAFNVGQRGVAVLCSSRTPMDLQHGSERLVVDPQPPRRAPGVPVSDARSRHHVLRPRTTSQAPTQPLTTRTAPRAHRTRHHRHRPRLPTRRVRSSRHSNREKPA